MGRSTVAVAESATKVVIAVLMRVIAKMRTMRGSDRRAISCWPTTADKPDACNFGQASYF